MNRMSKCGANPVPGLLPQQSRAMSKGLPGLLAWHGFLRTSLFFAFLYVLFASPLHAQTDKPAEKDYVINEKFVENGAPAPTTPFDLTASQTIVKQEFLRAEKNLGKTCAIEKSVWVVDTKNSLLEVTAFKDLGLPVKAKFEKFFGYLVLKGEQDSEAFLWIDTTSYNSGVANRDHRIIQYILGGSDPKNAVAALQAKQHGKDHFRGRLKLFGSFHSTNAPLTITREAKKIRLQSTEALRIKPKMKSKNFQTLIELCNHQSLAKVVDLSWDLTLIPGCP